MKGSNWKNKKYSGVFLGTYVAGAYGERNFVLKRARSKNQKPLHIAFESHEAAKALGWRKQAR